MKRVLTVPAVLAVVLLGVGPTRAAEPTAKQIVDRMTDALGGRDALAELGVLEVVVSEDETKTDGSTSNKVFTAYVSASDLENMRVEMDNGVVVVRNGLGGWATIRGKVDPRPQSPRKASGSAAQRLFPLLLPFTVTLEGIGLRTPVSTTFEGEPAWKVPLSFVRNFFSTPIMNTTWNLYVSKKDHSLIAAEYQPDAEYSEVAKEGVRYRVMRSTKIGGVTLPAQVMIEGIDSEGLPTSHTRISNLAVKKLDRVDATLFMHPSQVRAIEEGEILVP